jgi:hypothetical protein
LLVILERFIGLKLAGQRLLGGATVPVGIGGAVFASRGRVLFWIMVASEEKVVGAGRSSAKNTVQFL